MSLSRRTFLGLTAAATAGLSSLLLGSVLHPAFGAELLAPGTEFALGVRQFNWSRGARSLYTKVFHPAPGEGSGGGTSPRSSPEPWP